LTASDERDDGGAKDRRLNDSNGMQQLALAAIRAGELPRRAPERVWAGPGTGRRCRVCDQPVQRNQVEYELEFARSETGCDEHNLHFHVSCFTAWDLERRRATSAAAPVGDLLPGGGDDPRISAREDDTPSTSSRKGSA
jgi:hypothetical protein